MKMLSLNIKDLNTKSQWVLKNMRRRMKEIDVRSCISREKEVKDGEKNLPER
jgi:hypothetical protein